MDTLAAIGLATEPPSLEQHENKENNDYHAH